MSVTIFIEFPPEQEGITWTKREPRIINLKKPKRAVVIMPESQKEITYTTTKKEINRKDDIFKEFSNVQLYINTRMYEARKNVLPIKKEQFIGRLKILIKVINENNNYYENKNLVEQSLQKIDTLIKFVEEKKYGVPGITKKPNSINKYKSQKGLEVEKQLNAIKPKLKRTYIPKFEREGLLNELAILKKDIEKNMATFKGVDNIPCRLNQIEQYCQKLQNMNDTVESPKAQNVENNNSDSTKKKKRVVLRSFSLNTK